MPSLRSYVHRGGDEPLLGVTVDEMFRTIAERFTQSDAVVCVQQGERLTYAELDCCVEDAARAMLAMGIVRGDRVGVWSTDNAVWVVLQLATARIGAVLVNINPAYRVSELRHSLRLAEVNAIFLIPSFRSSDYVGMLRELVPEIGSSVADNLGSQLFPNLRFAVVWDPDEITRADRWAPGLLTWAEFLERGAPVTDAVMTERAAELDPDDPINIQFTSGTTGFPKAVVLTHNNIVNNAFFTARAMSFTERDRLCVPLPFYHCFGMVVSNLVCLSKGACIVIPSDHFEPGVTLRAIEQERCTAIHGVPTMFAAELDHPDFSTFDTSSLRTGIMAGAPCPPELMRRVIEEMGCKEILIGYGQTESAPIITLTHPADSVERRLRTGGTPIEHQEVKVIDHETGAVLPIGAQGEICIRGYNVMREYYAQREATKAAIDDARWLHTGDLGVMDPDGYISITGRLKDMIIRGGENIYPAEIEAFYFEHPGIEQIAVFGCPHESYGEEVGAWVRMRPGMESGSEELREHAKGKIAHYKVPTHVWFVEEFPATVTGKIQKNRMAEAVVRWRQAGGEQAPNGVECYIPSPAAPTRNTISSTG